MAYVKIEPTGCCERKGMVQVRFAMYLESTDYGYDKHHVTLPVIPAEDYTGKVSETGSPVDIDDYNKWIATLPTITQNNPFHSHFIHVTPDTTEKEIMDIGEAFLNEAYVKWAQDEKLDLNNNDLTIEKKETYSTTVADKVSAVKAMTAERKI
jgi:hypothetical protein